MVDKNMNNESDALFGVVITQFILYMQHQNVWPCKLEFGESPKPLTGEEVMTLKDSHLGK